MLETETGYSTNNHTSSVYPEATSYSSGTRGGLGGGGGAPGQPPPTAGSRVASASLWRALSILLATGKGLISNQAPKEQQKRYSQPSRRLTGSCTVTKRDHPTEICPFRPAQQKQAQEEQLELPCPCSTNVLLARATVLALVPKQLLQCQTLHHHFWWSHRWENIGIVGGKGARRETW